MQSKFERSCKAAREAIAVPVMPLGAIRSGVQRPRGKTAGRRRRGVIAAIVASVSIVAAAAAAEVFGHVQVSLNPSGAVHLYFDGSGGYRRPVRNPTEQDFQNAARAMNFPIIFPKGLPKGTVAEGLVVLSSGAMQIIYDLPGTWRRSNHLLVVVLANPKSVAPENAKPPHSTYNVQFGQRKGIGGVHWMIGQEEVIVLKSTITPAEFARFKAVMMAQAQPVIR